MIERYRSYGKTRDCRGCRFWSEQKAIKDGDRFGWKCLCLNRDSPRAYLYTRGKDYCPKWEDGEFGAVDDPDNKGVY